MNKTVKLYYTSDTHGYMFPTDYVNKAIQAEYDM